MSVGTTRVGLCTKVYHIYRITEGLHVEVGSRVET